MTVVALPKGTEVKGFTACVHGALPPISFCRGEGKPQGNSREPKHLHGGRGGGVGGLSPGPAFLQDQRIGPPLWGGCN